MALIGLLGLILSITGLLWSRKKGETGKLLAIAGIIISAVIVLLGLTLQYFLQ